MARQNINRGTAIKMCLVIDSKDICIKTDQGRFKPHIAARELPNPKTRKIGTVRKSSIKDKKIANVNIYTFLLKNFL